MSENITVNSYVIHYLDKDQKKTEARLDFSKAVSKEDEFSKVLVSEVHKSINESSSVKNTVFKANTSNDFTTTLNEYFSLADSESFYNFSKSIEELKTKIEKEPFAIGGYYFFCDYSIDNRRYVMVVLLRKKSGINIIKEKGQYVLDNTENVNIDKIAMAFRLNYSLYEDAENIKNYIALITTQQNGEISNYFKEWVCAGDFIKNTQNTETLISIVKSLPIPKDDDGEDIFENTNDFIKSVYEYAQPRANMIISLKDMGKHFYNDENFIINFANEKDYQLDPEFKRDSAVWRRLVTIRAKVDGIELNVDFNKINETDVVLDEEEDRIIINSKILTELIKNQYSSRVPEKDNISPN